MLFAYILLLLCGLFRVNGLKDIETLDCYHCGSETDSGWDLPCEKFNFQPMFEGPCTIDHFCFKTLSNTGHIVRGCAARKTAADTVIHKAGCHVTPDSALTNITIVCLCDKPLCNSSTVNGVSKRFLFIFTGIYFLILYQGLHYSI